MSRIVLSLAVVTALSLYGIPAWAAESKVESKEIKYDYTKTGSESKDTGGGKVEPAKDEPVKDTGKDPGKDPGKDEPEDGGECVEEGGLGSMTPVAGEEGVYEIVVAIDPEMPSTPITCTCYDVDGATNGGNNPDMPGGVAVVCNGTGYKNLSQLDGVVPREPGYYYEYVCGHPNGSEEHLKNNDVTVMSKFKYKADSVEWTDVSARPAWMGRFFAKESTIAVNPVEDYTVTPGAGGGSCKDEGDDEDAGDGKDEPVKEDPKKEDPKKEEPVKEVGKETGKGEPVKEDPKKEGGKGYPEKTKPMTKEEMIRAEAEAKAAAEAAAKAAEQQSKEQAQKVISIKR